MEYKKEFNIQKALDNIIDKLFLWFIPKWVKPNHVTFIRFILVPVVYWLIATGNLYWALVVFTIAASTDFIDGAMARTRDQITDLGKVIDPIADKLLILSVLAQMSSDFLLAKVFIVFIVFEIFAVLFGYFFAFAIGKPIGANVFGKIKLILQSFSVSFFILGVVTSNDYLVSLSVYALFAALFFAVVSGIEVARIKVRNYLEEHKINVIYSEPE